MFEIHSHIVSREGPCPEGMGNGFHDYFVDTSNTYLRRGYVLSGRSRYGLQLEGGFPQENRYLGKGKDWIGKWVNCEEGYEEYKVEVR